MVCRDQDDFDNHSNLHKEVSPLQCIHCKRNFMQRGHLAKHMLSHVSILIAVKIGYTYLLRTLIFSSSVLVTWSIGRQLQGHYWVVADQVLQISSDANKIIGVKLWIHAVKSNNILFYRMETLTQQDLWITWPVKAQCNSIPETSAHSTVYSLYVNHLSRAYRLFHFLINFRRKKRIISAISVVRWPQGKLD